MSIRLEKIEKALKQEIGHILSCDMNDPRIGFVTVTRVEAAPDIRSAKVYVTVLGNEKSRKSTMASLKYAKGYLQKEVASRLRMKFTPTLSFYIDEESAKSLKIAALMDKVASEFRENDDGCEDHE